MICIPAKYIADDGSVFRDEIDCIQYETKIKMEEYLKSGKLKCFNSDYKPVTDPNKFNTIVFIYVTDEDTFDDVTDYLIDEGVDFALDSEIDNYPARLCYNDRRDKWKNFDDILKEVNEIDAILK